MAVSEFENRQWKKELDTYIEKVRPPAHIRNEVDISYRIDNQNVEIFEIRPAFNEPSSKVENMVAKARYFKSRKLWAVYWMRADLKWHKYEPNEYVKNLSGFIEVIEKDEYGCFWG